MVIQRYSPAGWGAYPGILIVPETHIAWIGAGERLLAYRLEPSPVRLWTDCSSLGFHSWERYGNFILMRAELECAAWTIYGEKLWAVDVEPPWEFIVEGEIIHLDNYGVKSQFPIATGPSK